MAGAGDENKSISIWTTEEDDYQVNAPVGLGGTAIVSSAKHIPSGRKCAIKRVRKRGVKLRRRFYTCMFFMVHTPTEKQLDLRLCTTRHSLGT